MQRTSLATVRHLAAALVVLLAVGQPTAWAAAPVRVEGHTYDAQAQVAGQALQLNGAGLRWVAWLKGYTAALYLPHTAQAAEQVLTMPGPKRLRMQMLQDVSTQEFVKAFDKGVKRNTPEAELPGLQPRMQQFESIVASLGRVKKGDVVDLDQVPGRGLVFQLNGQPRGEPVRGDDLYAALLRIFIGDKPTQEELKRGLLGGPWR